MSGKEKSSRTGEATTQATLSCYCDGARQVGSLELLCSGCSKWFHGSCLKDLADLKALPFSVCYTFTCKNCSPRTTETWTPKQANFIHMCVTGLANLTKEQCANEGIPLVQPLPQHCFFNLEKQIIPFITKNWTWLTSMPPRTKNTWHATVQKTLATESHLFMVDPNDGNSFALVDLDLSSISPSRKVGKQIGRKRNLSTRLVDQSKAEQLSNIENGPKTRGTMRKVAVESSVSSKKKAVDAKIIDPRSTDKKKPKTTDYASFRFGGRLIAIPFNKDGYHYYQVEDDKIAYDKSWSGDDTTDACKARSLPGHLYRMATREQVTLSPHDRAYQLRVSDDLLSIAGDEGYCVARATHSVSAGKWYFEVQFTKELPESAVRIGWAQQYAPVQTCVGYNKFSYGWRSSKGTKFHDAKGKTYYPNGFKEGDVLGCLISLPFDPIKPEPDSSKYLPNSGKDLFVIKHKNNYFFEEYAKGADVVQGLVPLEGSYIEFFHNGRSCGPAYTDIYGGSYFPAVSIYQKATLRMNFGPTFTHPPPEGVKAMSERPDEEAVEQTLADMIYLVDNDYYKKQ